MKGNNHLLREKFDTVFQYFESKPTQDRWERVVNWLEGLERGFRSSRDLLKVKLAKEEILRYGNREGLEYENFILADSQEKVIEIMKTYSFIERKTTWQNNFIRNKAYLKGGYNHFDLNLFMNLLYSTFTTPEVLSLGKNYQLEVLERLRIEQPGRKKTIHFFF